ncbi:hypothetical protein H6P81_010573 [Aristolochia fimbriata]|uniref:Uncharacterized protein n=1 Tax=Aristolochia fimbriata TaxID=158543 RepID=A0AAV7EP57_ARIFI|nr:hypothetical protein H6P81_010573 [Aristolochia fimbriata]
MIGPPLHNCADDFGRMGPAAALAVLFPSEDRGSIESFWGIGDSAVSRAQDRKGESSEDGADEERYVATMFFFVVVVVVVVVGRRTPAKQQEALKRQPH